MGFYFTWRDVSQSCGFGESVRRAMIANKVRVFIAFKGHPYVEDFKWVLYLVNQLVECVM